MAPPLPNHLSELMSLLAHDMRNPLSAVLTNINFVEAVHARARGRGRRGAGGLGAVLHDARAGHRQPRRARPRARDVRSHQAGHGGQTRGRRAAARFAPQAAASGVRIEVHETSKATALLVEPTFFTRALDNLIANALQYSPANGLVRIECGESGDRGFVSVADEGAAIPADLRELALSPEWQSQAKQRYEARYGRGLGLDCAAEAARIAGADLKIGERDGRSALELSGALAK